MKLRPWFLDSQIVIVLIFTIFTTFVLYPAYGLITQEGEVKYSMFITEPFDYHVKSAMAKDQSYTITFKASNKNKPIKEYSVTLPMGFEERFNYAKEYRWPNKSWEHILGVKAPNQIGQYNFKYQCKDADNEEVVINVPINVVDQESFDDAMGYGQGIGGLVLVGGLVVACFMIYAVLSAMR